MFQQCHEMQGNKFDKQIHFGSAPPKSVGEYLAEKSSEDAFTLHLLGEDKRMQPRNWRRRVVKRRKKGIVMN